MTTFLEESAAARQAQDTYIRQEVLNDEERAAFTGLKFYPADERYVFRLRPQLTSAPQDTERPTSRGETRHFLRGGTVTVPFPDGEATLTLYAAATDSGLEHLFIPFRDATSGRETYGAGRSLNVRREGDHVVLDFNQAHNLYCAYGDRWNCALPPAENSLAIAVPVGEKVYRQTGD